MTKHTPTPWVYRKITLGHPDNARNPIISREAGGYIARLFSTESTLPGMTSLAPPAEQAEANAAYIVRAVNTHADLIVVLNELLDCYAAVVELAGQPWPREESINTHNRRVEKAVQQAREVISEAEKPA